MPIAKAGSYNRAEALRARVDESISASVWNKLFRSDLWKNVRFPDGHNYEDVDTTFRVLNLCSRVNVIDQTLYLYRMRPGSITHTSSRKNIEDWFLAYDHVAAFVQAHIPEIFDETHLRKVRQTRINKALHSFCLGHMSIDELKDVFEGEKTEHLSFRSRAAYQMARLCPCLLRALYAPYRSFRMKRRKVSER